MASPYTLRLAEGYVELTYHRDGSPAVHLLAAGELLDTLREQPSGVLVDWSNASDDLGAGQAGQVADLVRRHPELFSRGVAFLVDGRQCLEAPRVQGEVAELGGVAAELFTDREMALDWLKGGGLS